MTTLVGDQIHYMADQTALQAIATEIVTEGRMRMTGKMSGLQACRNRGLIEGRTTNVAGFRKALKAMDERWENWTPLPSVQAAIDKLEAEKQAKKEAKKKK